MDYLALVARKRRAWEAMGAIRALATAENRDLTPAEMATFELHEAELRAVSAQLAPHEAARMALIQGGPTDRSAGEFSARAIPIPRGVSMRQHLQSRGTINAALPNDFGFGPAKIDLPDNPIPTIPHLARGGLVVAGDNPSGIEAIVPLERAHEFGFGGRAAVENHFHMSFHGFVGDIDELIRQFDLKLRRSGRPGLPGA